MHWSKCYKRAMSYAKVGTAYIPKPTSSPAHRIYNTLFYCSINILKMRAAIIILLSLSGLANSLSKGRPGANGLLEGQLEANAFHEGLLAAGSLSKRRLGANALSEQREQIHDLLHGLVQEQSGSNIPVSALHRLLYHIHAYDPSGRLIQAIIKQSQITPKRL